MKIIKILVKQLFGTFDHEVPLNTEEHITILHGPNGVGKTVLLRMMNSLFRSNYYELYHIPFCELTVKFDDRSKLSVNKKLILGNNGNCEANHNGDREIIFEYVKPGEKKYSYVVRPLKLNEISDYFKIENVLPELEKIDSDTWVHFPTQEKLTSEEVMDLFSDRLPQTHKDEPEWLRQLLDSINICFIQTQRLFSISYSNQPIDPHAQTSITPSVVNYSKQLARVMQNKLSEYASLSQSLDRTFPARMIKAIPQKTSRKELTQQLKELEKKRSKLIDTGFLDPEDGMDIKDLNDIPGSKIEVLQLYTEDIQKKLSVFDDLTARIELLIKIINWRFLYKKLSIDREDGFVFTTYEGMHLSPTKLSSGEQQELVLFYELLFHVLPNSLILIDEPEISLHVLWQQQFLKDLQAITKLVGFDILIATHSPQIIHDRWDLTVELRGNDNEKIPHSG